MGVIFKGYEITKQGIKPLNLDILFREYKDILFKDVRTFNSDFMKRWIEIKQKVIKDPNKKTVDNMQYSVAVNQNGKILILATGTGKKPTLEKIFLQEKDKLDSKDTTDNEQNKPSDTLNKDLIVDLEDSNIDINTRIQALTGHKLKVKGKFNEDDTYQYLRSLLGDSVNKVKESKDQLNPFFQTFAKVLKINQEDIENHSYFKASQIAKYIQEAKHESEVEKDWWEVVMAKGE